MTDKQNDSKTPIDSPIEHGSPAVEIDPNLAAFQTDSDAHIDAANDDHFEPEEKPIDTKGAEELALMSLGAGLAGFNALTPYQLDVDSDKAKEFSKGVAPVIKKYAGHGAPSWFAKYKEEMRAFGAVLTLGVGLTSQYLQQKRFLAEQAANDDKPKGGKNAA